MHRLRRKLTAVVVSIGFASVAATGLGAGAAHADVLDDLAAEYSVGAGAGQIANLLNESIALRSQGFTASRQQYTAINDALGYRPNQQPLTQALQSAVTSQRRLAAESQVMAGNGPAPTANNACDFTNQWQVRQRQGGLPWPPLQQFCQGPFPNNGGVVIGGGQTVQIGGGGAPVDGGYKIGNGR